MLSKVTKRNALRFARSIGACFSVTLGVAANLSCQMHETRISLWDNADERMVWPLPPEKPRIEYVGAFPQNDDGDMSMGARKRVMQLLAGKKKVALVKPIAVAKNRAGLVAVVDAGTPALHMYDLNKELYWQPKTKGELVLRSPVGVAVDKAGMVYVSDSVAGKVFVFEQGKKLLRDFGGGALTRPTGLAFSPNEDSIYVVDTIDCQVVAFDLTGKELARFGKRGSGPGQFNFPTYIAALPDGGFCVSDSLNFRVQVFDSKGVFKHMFGKVGDGAGDLARPKGVAADSAGRIYAVDAAFENVQIFSPEGGLLLAFGSSGKGQGAFSLPCGIFMDADNTIWVADSFNQRIQVFRLLE